PSLVEPVVEPPPLLELPPVDSEESALDVSRSTWAVNSVVFKSGLLLSPEANKSPTLLRSIYDTEIPTSPADTPVPGVSSTVPSGETSTQSTSRDTFDMKT